MFSLISHFFHYVNGNKKKYNYRKAYGEQHIMYASNIFGSLKFVSK
jgi:hypothetical protein